MMVWTQIQVMLMSRDCIDMYTLKDNKWHTHTHNSGVQRDSNRLDHSAKHKRRQTEDCASPTSIVLLMLAMKPIVFKVSRTIEMYELKKHSRYKYIVMTHKIRVPFGDHKKMRPWWFQPSVAVVLSKPKALQEVQSRGVPLQVAQVPPVEQALQRPQLPARCRSWRKVGNVDDVIIYIHGIYIIYICTVHFVCTVRIQYITIWWYDTSAFLSLTSTLVWIYDVYIYKESLIPFLSHSAAGWSKNKQNTPQFQILFPQKSHWSN